MEIGTKKQLAVILSRLKGYRSPKSKLEQYKTEPDIAAEITWFAFYRREIKERRVADLGCGTGVLGISTLLMGAEKVFFVDIDEDSITLVKENIAFLEEETGEELASHTEYRVLDVAYFDENVDVVIQNPPFGLQGKRHADKQFLEQAMKISPLIYSFHKLESQNFIDAVCKDHGFMVTHKWKFQWPLRQTMKHHTKKVQHIEVGCWRMAKI